MSELALSGATPPTLIPSVVLTERLFEQARERGIVDVTPNPAHMQAIAELTGVSQEQYVLPDITTMRHAKRFSLPGSWDITLQKVPDDTKYFVAADLGVTERDPRFIFAGSLRQHQLDTGKTILDLSVPNWSRLGGEFAGAIEILKRARKGVSLEGAPQHVVDSLGGVASKIVRISPLQSSSQKREHSARDLQPYNVVYRKAD